VHLSVPIHPEGLAFVPGGVLPGQCSGLAFKFVGARPVTGLKLPQQ
jgi:hypothetical protein